MSTPNYSGKLLLDEYPLIVLPSLAGALGLGDAIFTQQIHFWLKIYELKDDLRHYHRGCWWVYNTIQDWHEQMPFLSPRSLDRILQRGRDRGTLITANYNLWSYDHTLWYTLDYDRIDHLVERWQSKRAHKRAHRLRQNGVIEQATLAECITPEWRDPLRQDGVMYHRSATEISTETSQIWHTATDELNLIISKQAQAQLRQTQLLSINEDTCILCQPPTATQDLTTHIQRTLSYILARPITVVYQEDE